MIDLNGKKISIQLLTSPLFAGRERYSIPDHYDIDQVLEYVGDPNTRLIHLNDYLMRAVYTHPEFDKMMHAAVITYHYQVTASQIDFDKRCLAHAFRMDPANISFDVRDYKRNFIDKVNTFKGSQNKGGKND